MKTLLNIFAFYKQTGIVGFTKQCYYKLFDIYYEKHFNVSTQGEISTEALGSGHESFPYEPLFYRYIFNVLNRLPADKKQSTFLDYGCGKGRAVIGAGSYQFKKIIGLEISSLIDDARANLEHGKNLKTKNIEWLHCDARDYKVPSDVNIIYFFNPFGGSVLEEVTKNIRTSFENSPRKIYIIFFNHTYAGFDKIAENQTFLTKVEESVLNNSMGFALYETMCD